MQKDVNAGASEAADILPQLPDELRRTVLWYTQDVMIDTCFFLKVHWHAWHSFVFARLFNFCLAYRGIVGIVRIAGEACLLMLFRCLVTAAVGHEAGGATFRRHTRFRVGETPSCSADRAPVVHPARPARHGGTIDQMFELVESVCRCTCRSGLRHG